MDVPFRHSRKGIAVTRKDVELLERTSLYKGFFELALYKFRHRLFAGGWSRPISREIFLRDPVAAVLPYDPKRDAVVLIEQFRAGPLAADHHHPWLIEIVAGIIEPGEAPEDMARRETMEEAGCTVTTLEPIVSFAPSPGGCSEFVQLYCGCVDSDGVGGIHGLPHEDEDIRVFVEPAEKAIQRVRDGEIESSIAIIGLLWLALNREDLRSRWA
jgi:ADP-ribose pyrophosphatase